MENIYETLIKDMSSLRNAEEADTCGMDEFIEPKKAESQEKLPDKVKLAGLGDLSNFFRISNNTLVHKSEKDLWRISESEKDGCFIERLFNPETKEPIRV